MDNNPIHTSSRYPQYNNNNLSHHQPLAALHPQGVAVVEEEDLLEEEVVEETQVDFLCCRLVNHRTSGPVSQLSRG